MDPLLLSGPEWLAVLRIGIGLWWLESWRHKDKKAWFERNAGIDWAASVAAKHKWAFVRRMFERVVAPRPKAMSYMIVFAELAIGLGLVLGFLDADRGRRRAAAQRVLPRADDPRLGRAGSELVDDGRRGRDHRHPGMGALVHRPRHRLVLGFASEEVRRGGAPADTAKPDRPPH